MDVTTQDTSKKPEEETTRPAPEVEEDDDDDTEDDEDDDTTSELPADLNATEEGAMEKGIGGSEPVANVTTTTDEALIKGIGAEFHTAVVTGFQPVVTLLETIVGSAETMQKSMAEMTEQMTTMQNELETLRDGQQEISKALDAFDDVRAMSKAISDILDKSAQQTTAPTPAPAKQQMEVLQKALVPSPTTPALSEAEQANKAVLEKALPLIQKGRELRDRTGVVLPAFLNATEALNAGILQHRPQLVAELEAQLAAA